MLVHEMFRLMEAGDFDEDEAHWNGLARTGHYAGPDGAAGCIFFARDTRRFLIAHRSAHVLEPHEWGTWGGALNRGEAPEHGVRREAAEETGIADLTLIPLYVFHGNQGFRYFNFVAVIDHEVHPRLNWETEGFKWCQFGKWPQPLHKGLKALFADQRSMTVLKGLASGEG